MLSPAKPCQALLETLLSIAKAFEAVLGTAKSQALLSLAEPW